MSEDKAEKPKDKKPLKIESTELYVLFDSGVSAEGRQTKIRAVQWTIDGKKKPPRLEKRNFHKSGKTDQMLTGEHPEALSLEEVVFLREHAGELDKAIEAMKAAAK